jgi:class 3 adenylate cyclase
MFFTAGAIFLCLCTMALFLVHGNVRTKQQKRIEASAEHDNAILSSLYPAQVRERMLKVNDVDATLKGRGLAKEGGDKDEDEEVAKLLLTKPIADLFPNATVLFADIWGFSSWSSERQPVDVFILLETLFGAFDLIAKKELIFKVETIGDCYVAVTGLPDPREDHAEAMSLFALKCVAKMRVIFDDLVSELGPETANLSMRFGLHSGPVTAGVLRGEKSRFQLFGDT